MIDKALRRVSLTARPHKAKMNAKWANPSSAGDGRHADLEADTLF
jgi:hypothetical protein